MNIHKIGEVFPDITSYDVGDLGWFVSIRIVPEVYFSVFENESVPNILTVKNIDVDMPYIKSIDDLKILIKLFNGET